MNDRHTAITHRNQLTQSAWLKARRHQKHIATCVNTLCQLGVKRKENSSLLRIASRYVLEHLMIVLIAYTQDHKLYPLSNQWLYNLRQQIKPLLIGEARDHRQQGRICTNRQVRSFLEYLLILHALIQGTHAEVGMNIAIRCRIIFLIINTIENAKHAITARAQQVIELLTKGGRQDLLSIAFTHRCYRIGEQNA